MFHFPHFYATDLAGGDFWSLVRNSTAEYILVDFYAPWCPHCQHFAPEYERLALAVSRFNSGTAAVHGRAPKILCAEVDCVQSASTCNQFGIQAFPTLLWGRKAHWFGGEQLERVEVDEATAEAAAAWIGKRVNVSLDLSGVSRQAVAKRFLPLKAVQKATASRAAEMWDAQVATALLLHGIFAQHGFPVDAAGAGAKTALLNFVKLLAQRFPEAGGTPCRASLSVLHERLGQHWSDLTSEIDVLEPGGTGSKLLRINPANVERTWRLCGTEWDSYRQGFKGCRGTFPGKRGFTCGLWTLFHMLAARTDDATASADTLVVRDMLSHFFDCRECREHFFKIDFVPSDLKDRRSAQLWWWHAHNLVNNRVGELERRYGDGDPSFPKVAWPTEQQCPDCRLPPTQLRSPSGGKGAHVRANEAGLREHAAGFADLGAAVPWKPQAVAAFLARFYGP